MATQRAGHLSARTKRIGQAIARPCFVAIAQGTAIKKPEAADSATKGRRSTGVHGDTCQAEAIPPDVLADILCDIDARIDHQALDRVRRLEKQARRKLSRVITKVRVR